MLALFLALQIQPGEVPNRRSSDCVVGHTPFESSRKPVQCTRHGPAFDMKESAGSASTAGKREFREADGGRRCPNVARPTATTEVPSPDPLAFFVASRAVSVGLPPFSTPRRTL